MGLNSTLNGGHRIRAINVRANILAEWTADQVRIRAEVTKYGVGIALCVVALAVCLPIAVMSQANVAAIQSRHESSLKALNAELVEARALQKARAPGVATSTIRTQTARYFDRLMGETYAVLDAANSGIAFSSAKVNVRSAEIAIDCRADAENYDAAAAFARQAGSTTNEISSLASMKPSPLLGPVGISFEYLKRVAVK